MDFGDLQQLQAAFRSEAADLLADLGDALLLLENDRYNMELINRIFRAMHTLKGSGATAGFSRLANFVHHVEEVFNRIRNRQLEASTELIDAGLKSCDCCAELLELGGADMATPVVLVDIVLAAIQPFLPEAAKVDSMVVNRKMETNVSEHYTIGFRPNREIFFSGTDPASLLLELTELGEMTVRCETAALSGAEEFDPEQCYLSWTVTLDTTQLESSVRGIFQFVEDDCEVVIERLDAALSPAEKEHSRFQAASGQFVEALHIALAQCEAGEESQGLGNARRVAQNLVAASLAHGSASAAAAANAVLAEIVAARQGSILDSNWLRKLRALVEFLTKTLTQGLPPITTPDAIHSSIHMAVGTSVQPQVASKVAAKPEDTAPAPASEPRAAVAQSIRVDSVKLDALMRLAGELLVARGALPAFADRYERCESLETMAKEMRDAGNKLARLADDLQATVMSIRMLPVRQVFQRFPRLVRDIARNLDKDMDLQVSGEETELDKTVIDSIGDPLTHIIRNAADHGIESRAERASMGKAATGHISLAAFTRGSNVVIEVQDDGKGLDPGKLKRRALEKGLYTEAALAAMDDEAAYRIIFAAGFSTVDTVTDLSGRGVGMDVVRSSVEALRGTIHIQSGIGKGTCFRIELPASLLVSKGILVSAAGQRVVLPMETIRNMVKVPQAILRKVNGQQIAMVRGTVFPILSLAQALSFGWQGIDEGDEQELAIAIIDATSGPYGLVVDRFLGEVEVVVKPMSGFLAHVPEYVGAAIMGDGRTVLVVNTDKLFSLQNSVRGSHVRQSSRESAVAGLAA